MYRAAPSHPAPPSPPPTTPTPPTTRSTPATPDGSGLKTILAAGRSTNREDRQPDTQPARRATSGGANGLDGEYWQPASEIGDANKHRSRRGRKGQVDAHEQSDSWRGKKITLNSLLSGGDVSAYTYGYINTASVRGKKDDNQLIDGAAPTTGVLKKAIQAQWDSLRVAEPVRPIRLNLLELVPDTVKRAYLLEATNLSPRTLTSIVRKSYQLWTEIAQQPPALNAETEIRRISASLVPQLPTWRKLSTSAWLDGLTPSGKRRAKFLDQPLSRRAQHRRSEQHRSRAGQATTGPRRALAPRSSTSATAPPSSSPPAPVIPPSARSRQSPSSTQRKRQNNSRGRRGGQQQPRQKSGAAPTTSPPARPPPAAAPTPTLSHQAEQSHPARRHRPPRAAQRTPDQRSAGRH
jgi:hypothetical protein